MRGRLWRIQKVNRILADPLCTGCFCFNCHDSRTRKERPQPDWIAVSVLAIIDASTFARAAKRRVEHQTSRRPRPGQWPPPRPWWGCSSAGTAVPA